MHRLLPLLTIASLLLGATACGDAAEVVDDATDQIDRTAGLLEFCADALQLIAALEDRSFDDAGEQLGDLQESAPDEISPEVDVVASGLRAFQEGDEQAVQTDEFTTAVEELVAFTRDNCDPR